MDVLWLTPTLAYQIVEEAEQGAPNEVCGIIVGRGDEVTDIIPVENVADDPTRLYEMDPAALARHLPRLDREGLSLIGFYHSHPSHDPIPSPTDVAQAHYPNTAYVIASLKYEHPRLAAWIINYGEVTPIPIHVGEDPPPANVYGREGFSPAQRFAIIVMAILALATLIALSLYLLPPAPIIPR